MSSTFLAPVELANRWQQLAGEDWRPLSNWMAHRLDKALDRYRRRGRLRARTKRSGETVAVPFSRPPELDEALKDYMHVNGLSLGGAVIELLHGVKA